MIICKVITKRNGIVLKENKEWAKTLTYNEKRYLSDALHIVWEVWNNAKKRIEQNEIVKQTDDDSDDLPY